MSRLRSSVGDAIGGEQEIRGDVQHGAERLGVVAIIALIVLTIANHLAIELLGCCGTRDGVGVALSDGTNAGANAVTLVNLEREHEFGKIYPSNGKETPLYSDTTFSKGFGMVDLVTFDRRVNTEIRHYGQLQPSDTVRWYAAERVLDEGIKPVVMPRG